MRTIYTAAAYWSWVVLFLVWLPGYFLRKPAVRRPRRGRQLLTTVLLVGGYVLLGTALTIGRPASYLGVACSLAAFLIRVSDEDPLMAEEFPAAHQTYRGRTKALIPFVW